MLDVASAALGTLNTICQYLTYVPITPQNPQEAVKPYGLILKSAPSLTVTPAFKFIVGALNRTVA